MTAASFWWSFYRDHGAHGQELLVLPDDKVDRAKLAAQGWSLLWDSAFGETQARAASQEGELLGDDNNPVYAFERECSMCHDFRPTQLCRGMYWNERDQSKPRYQPWYGYACDYCQESQIDNMRYVNPMRRGRHYA